MRERSFQAKLQTEDAEAVGIEPTLKIEADNPIVGDGWLHKLPKSPFQSSRALPALYKLHPNRSLVVDTLNTSAAGGAAVAARRLHEGLLGMGVESRLWSKPAKRKSSDQPWAGQPLQLAHSAGLKDRIGAFSTKIRDNHHLKHRPAGLELFTTPWQGIPTPFDAGQLSGDLIHLHWVNRWLDWRSFFGSMPHRHPVVWTLHDMSPITGGCHHADGCEAFHQGCGNCPQLAHDRRGSQDVSQLGFHAKRLAYAGHNLHIVTPSRWLQRHAEKSGLMAEASIQTIHNGLNLQHFRPRSKELARQELGLPPDVSVIGFGAASMGNPRKGVKEFYEAVAKLKDPSRVICLGFGDRAEVPAIDRLPQVRTTGYLSTPEDLTRFYSACDIFVMPSLGENMPQTVIEAMACETPVAAFSVGGIPEVVQPGKTGLLAKLQDCDQLATQIDWLIDHPTERVAMGQRGRELVCEEFDLEKQSQKYVRLYEHATRAKLSSIARDLPRSA